MSKRTLSFVLFVDGLLLLILGATMVIPLLVDAIAGNPDWIPFAASAGFTLFFGGVLALAFRRHDATFDRRSGYLLTTSAWLIVGLFAALPLYFSSLHLSFVDAFFEAMSGLTTTGSTVISGLDDLPAGLLLWRSLTQWFGGVGIVVMALVMLPMLGIGGMQLYRTESSDISGKTVPRVGQIAGRTILVYVALSAACAIAFAFAGMSGFDAINHAMATIATGGFSTRDASIGYYNSLPIELVAIVFMTMSALPLFWYAQIASRRARGAMQERQVPALLAVLAAAIALATLWNVWYGAMPLGTALRLSAFNVTSVLTDTGFATTDFSNWGGFAVGLFFVLYLVGGSAGSTAGGIKMFRWQILFVGMRNQLRHMISPHRVLVRRYGERVVDDDMVQSVRNFFFMYLVSFLVLSLLVMATGLDFLSSTSAVAQAMANAGPGLGPLVGPATTFAAIPDPAKLVLVVAMLLGRLELSTIYVLLLRDYWVA